MGDVTGPYSSLTGFVGNWYVTGIIMALIVIGGLGFFVWKDLLDTRFRFSRMRSTPRWSYPSPCCSS